MMKKNFARFLIVVVAVWFMGGCAKKLMPPEVESKGGEQAGFAELAPSPKSEDVGGLPGELGAGKGGFLEEGSVGEKAGKEGGEGGKPGAEGFAALPGAGGAGDGGLPGERGGAGGAEGFGGLPGGEAGAGAGEKAMQEARMLPFQATTDLDDIHFAFDKYDLDDNSKKTLQKNAEWIKQHPGAKVEIQGHCDERGTNNYNLALGERRATATKKYLMALGVSEGQVYTISYGEERPFCHESNENCWWQNRRAHFMVSK
ncbi:MAG: peptidoglycan-associated lipoprotein Pal [Nitrospinae bacterium]|nr:peptidoglycan-associated lipoprotein Pal [Nitrospinota bacterium]